jgi:hypothetical protein
MRICLRDNIEFTEHDRYFDGLRSPVGDFARLYTWLGGEVFHLAVQAVLDLPRKELLEIHDVPLNPEDPEDGHPGFLSIVNEVMPMCVMLGKYTAPDVRDKIYKEADAIKERQSELTEQDLNLAGSRGKDANGKGGMKLFPHQAEALVALKAHPKIAILDIAPGGGKCGTYDMLVPTSTGLIKLGEAYETLSTGPADAHGFKPFRTRVMSHVGKAWTDRSYKTYGKTRKIILSDGSMFEGLPEHKLYCFTDAGLSFVRLDNLAEGTWLPRMIGTELFPTKVPNIDGHGPLSVGMCKLLGYLIAEGHVTSTTCSFTNYDPEVIAEFKQLLFAEFGSDVPVRETSRTGGKTTGIFINGSAKTPFRLTFPLFVTAK